MLFLSRFRRPGEVTSRQKAFLTNPVIVQAVTGFAFLVSPKVGLEPTPGVSQNAF